MKEHKNSIRNSLVTKLTDYLVFKVTLHFVRGNVSLPLK